MAALDPIELLFVGSNTKDWPINIYDSTTGSNLWSYKGSELQGEVPGRSVIVADEYVYTTIVGRPVISHVSMQSKNRSHFRSFVPGPVQYLAVTGDSSVCSGAVGEKIYTWMTGTGALTSILSGHYQAISKLQFTSDGSFLISSGKDGRILAWNMTDLLAPEKSAIRKQAAATRTWTAHSLPITDMKVGFGGVNCRVFTVSLDQSAKIHSLISGQLLMTLIFDGGLSACAVDDAETRLFVGTMKGDIVQVNLFMQPAARERHVQTAMESVENPVFRGHTQRITELCVNMDSTLLASGSEDKSVRIWHINSRQCVRTISCNGNITSLAFTPSLPVILDRDYACTHPIQQFQKQFTSMEYQGRVVVKLKTAGGDKIRSMPDDGEIDRMLADLKTQEAMATEFSRPSLTAGVDNEQRVNEDEQADDTEGIQVVQHEVVESIDEEEFIPVKSKKIRRSKRVNKKRIMPTC